MIIQSPYFCLDCKRSHLEPLGQTTREERTLLPPSLPPSIFGVHKAIMRQLRLIQSTGKVEPRPSRDEVSGEKAKGRQPRTLSESK